MGKSSAGAKETVAVWVRIRWQFYNESQSGWLHKFELSDIDTIGRYYLVGFTITLILEKHFPPKTREPLTDPDFRTRWYGWKKRAPTDSNPTLYGDRARERGALPHLTRQQWRRGVHVWVRIQGTTRHGEQLWCYSTSCSRCLWISKNGAKSRHSFYFSYISL